MHTPLTPQVLIVDRSPENREVLRTILRRDGVQTIEAGTGEIGLNLAQRWHPQVLVLDSDTIDLNDPAVCEGFDDEARQENSAVVLLGRIQDQGSQLSMSEVLVKPYHYGPLIRKIEELLQIAEPQAHD